MLLTCLLPADLRFKCMESPITFCSPAQAWCNTKCRSRMCTRMQKVILVRPSTWRVKPVQGQSSQALQHLPWMLSTKCGEDNAGL